MPNLQELRQARNDAFEAMQAIHDRCEAEDRGFVGDEKKEFDELTEKVESFDERLAVAERVATATIGKTDDQVEAEDRAAFENKRQGTPTPEDRNRAVAAWLAGRNATPDQRALASQCGVDLDANTFTLLPETRDMSVGTATAGGNAVPTTMLAEVDQALQAFGNVRGAGVRTITTPGGGAFEIPTVSDLNSGGILAENAADGETDPTVNQVTLNAYMVTSDIVNCSFQMLQDGVVDIEQLIGSLLGERIARGENALLTTGTGSSQHQGIVTGAADSSVTLASNTAITYAELLSLEHSVDPAYRQSGSAGFMMSDTIFKQVKSIQDSTGRPLWLPQDLQQGAPGTLLGYPVYLNQDMASGASSKCIVFGDFGKFFVRDVQGLVLRRSDSHNFDQFQTSFVAYIRSDSALVASAAVKFATAAS